MPSIYVPTLTLHDAATRFRNAGISTSEAKIADGIEQKVFPFGVCITIKGSRNFEIYAKQLDEYLAARAVPLEGK